MSNFIKMRPVGAEFLHADRETDGRTDIHEESNILFSQFCEHVYERHWCWGNKGFIQYSALNDSARG